MLDRSMDNVLEVKAFLGDTKLAKTVLCKICNEIVYDVPDKPTRAEIGRATDVVVLHLELQHGFRVARVSCNDPKCLGGH